jgi:hypothetical protein
MSENSSNDSYKNNNTKKQPRLTTTDYMVDYLKDSQKVVSPSQIQRFQKKEDSSSNNSDEKSYTSEDLGNYISDKHSEKKSDYQSDKKSEYTTHNNSNSNIFEKRFKNTDTYQNNPETKNESKESVPEDYDNYNELSPEQQMLKKLEMLRKLGELAQYGVKLSQNYNMNSDYFTMKYEHQLHTNIRAKQNFINWTSSIMLNCIYGIEILNEKYDPFSLKLSKWSEQINADISNYYDVFGEIYEKYNKPGKSMSPELKLILMIGGSALKFHLNNVAAQGRLGVGSGNFSLPNNGNVQSSNADPRVIENMRNQAVHESMMEQQRKQNELLNTKSEKEHNLANQQMKDMMFLQQKQTELAQREAIRKKQIEEFEKTRIMMERNNQNNNFNQFNQANQISQDIKNQKNIDSPLTGINMQRRNDIGEQLEAMKRNMSNIGMNVKEIPPAQQLYKSPAQNVKFRGKESNINVDTSSSDKKSRDSSKSDSSSSSNSSSKNSDTSEENTKVSKSTKSLNSKNNMSSFSKRRYKRGGITINT